MLYPGTLRKMITTLNKDGIAEYHLPIGEQNIAISSYLGSDIAFHFNGEIQCIACSRAIKKTFQQGYCFPCMRKLAQCDLCIVKPELCHYHLGTCREPEWGMAHCMQDHVVYLANSSSVKVGITRFTNIPSRWIDQGASQALPLLNVKSRYISGLVEVMLKDYVNDKTNWRKMLQGANENIDLAAIGNDLLVKINEKLNALSSQHGKDSYRLANGKVINIDYPVNQYPSTIRSLNFDKTPDISAKLLGIKGQYLILDSGVLNIRKFAGYTVNIDLSL